MKLIPLLKICIIIACQSVYAGYYFVESPQPYHEEYPDFVISHCCCCAEWVSNGWDCEGSRNLNPTPDRNYSSYVTYYESYYDENDFDQDLRTDDDVGRELEIN